MVQHYSFTLAFALVLYALPVLSKYVDKQDFYLVPNSNQNRIAIPRLRIGRSVLNPRSLEELRQRYVYPLGEITIDTPAVTNEELALLRRYFPLFEYFVIQDGQRVPAGLPENV